MVKNSNYLFIKTMLDAGIKGPLLPQLDKTSENEIIIRTKIYLCNIDTVSYTHLTLPTNREV